MSAADVKETLATQGFEQTISSTEELVISLRGEEKKWGRVVKKMGIRGGEKYCAAIKSRRNFE
jgi:hypothetical protein